MPSNTSKHELLHIIGHFCGSFLPSWIRIRIRIANTDPDPDPQPWSEVRIQSGSIPKCHGSGTLKIKNTAGELRDFLSELNKNNRKIHISTDLERTGADQRGLAGALQLAGAHRNINLQCHVLHIKQEIYQPELKITKNKNP
jgi:hypothetical protein